MSELLPVFLKLEGRSVLLVGGGRLAKAKLPALLDAGAVVRVVAPEIDPGIAASGVRLERRGFTPPDLDGAWLAVAAATPEINRAVSRAAEERRVFVNAVDDVAAAYGLPRRRRAQGRRGGGRLHRGPRARSRRPAARGARGRAARRHDGVGAGGRRRCAPGRRRAGFPSRSADRRCSRS